MKGERMSVIGPTFNWRSSRMLIQQAEPICSDRHTVNCVSTTFIGLNLGLLQNLMIFCFLMNYWSLTVRGRYFIDLFIDPLFDFC